MPKHSETNLERLRYGTQSWSEVMRDNAQRLEDTLLKVSGMLDVDLTGLADDDILRYNSSTEKWENIPYTTFFSTTTTSSTSTSSSSTSSSSTTTAP